MLESRAERTTDVVVLSEYPILPLIIKGIEFVTPFTTEVEPFGWSVRCDVRGMQNIVQVIVGVHV